MTRTNPRIDLARLLGPDARRSDEMQALWEWLVEQDKGMPDLNSLPITEARVYRARQTARTNADLPAVAHTSRFTVPGIAGAPAVACELIEPDNAQPGCVVFLHGGGWAFGDIESHARLARLLAIETGMRLLYVDYRLAPEHPYPAALNDSVAAWRWAVSQAASDARFAGPLAICGDSAGGNLAVAVMLHEQELGRRTPDLGMLFYGVYGDDTDSPSYLRFAQGFGLQRLGMMRFWEFYAPSETPGQPRMDPLLCPLRASEASLARLPPLFLNASHLDPLLCDTLRFCERLEQAGAQFEVHIHEGLQHGFMQQTVRLQEARRAFTLMGDFVRRVLSR